LPVHSSIFLSMMRRRPRPPLFPYTTLFRSPRRGAEKFSFTGVAIVSPIIPRMPSTSRFRATRRDSPGSKSGERTPMLAAGRTVRLNRSMTNPGTNPQNPDFQPAGEAFNQPPAETQLPAEPAEGNSSAPATTEAEVAPAAQAEQQERARQNVKGSVAASTWAALIIGALVLILLLVFILQNQTEAQLVFFGWEWS